MRLQHWILLATLFFPTLSVAFFCPTNFSQIDYGNSIEDVQRICGNPDKQETKVIKPEGAQEWSYYIPQTVASNSLSGSVSGTLKTQMAFDAQGKLINISVNGIGVGSSTICGQNIQLGDSRENVKKTCGSPSFINRQETDSAAPQEEKKIVEFTYNTNPPIKLIFENGKLKEKQ